MHHGGVYLNCGSAVILPEVFLKAVNLVRNLGHPLEAFTTVNLDFLQHYRPTRNVVQRPTVGSGKGIALTGHHELMIPLLAAQAAGSLLTIYLVRPALTADPVYLGMAQILMTNLLNGIVLFFIYRTINVRYRSPFWSSLKWRGHRRPRPDSSWCWEPCWHWSWGLSPAVSRASRIFRSPGCCGMSRPPCSWV